MNVGNPLTVDHHSVVEGDLKQEVQKIYCSLGIAECMGKAEWEDQP